RVVSAHGDHCARRAAARGVAERVSRDLAGTDLVARAEQRRRAQGDRSRAQGGEQPPGGGTTRDSRVLADKSGRRLSVGAHGARGCVLPDRCPSRRQLTNERATTHEPVPRVLLVRAQVPREEHLHLRLLRRVVGVRLFLHGIAELRTRRVPTRQSAANGPYALAYNQLAAALFGVIIISAIFGPSILRDFQRDTYQMLFTKPISKFAYLGGRWAASFVTCVFVFAGVAVGMWLGTYAPWTDQARIGP